MKKYKLLSIISTLFLLFSCSNEIRVEFNEEITLDNGTTTITAHAVETSKNIVIDRYNYKISHIGDTYDVTIPDTMTYYSRLEKQEFTWPVVGIGAGEGSVLFYPFYMQFEIPSLTKHGITFNITLGANIENITMSNVNTYLFFNGDATASSQIELTYKVFYNIDENNKAYESDEEGYVYRKVDNPDRNRLPIDYGTREEATE